MVYSLVNSHKEEAHRQGALFSAALSVFSVKRMTNIYDSLVVSPYDPSVQMTQVRPKAEYDKSAHDTYNQGPEHVKRKMNSTVHPAPCGHKGDK